MKKCYAVLRKGDDGRGYNVVAAFSCNKDAIKEMTNGDGYSKGWWIETIGQSFERPSEKKLESLKKELGNAE